MVDIPLEKLTNEGVAHIYRTAGAIFKKQCDPAFYELLQRQGMEMLENGIELPMEQLKFYGCTMQDYAQVWIETRRHGENYIGKHAEFEKTIKAYFA